MIYIVTPVFNRKEFTRNYLKALEKQTNKKFKIVIVDDGSTDGTAEMIEAEFPNVICLVEKGDLWWAEATNIGVKYALNEGANYIMTLNDDTIPYEDYIEKMYYWTEKEPNALLGALAINNFNGQIEDSGGIHSWKSGNTKHIKLSKDQQKGLHEVNYFPGRGLVIPKKVFEDIGFYDSKNFPQTVADYDFTYMAVNAGYKIYCNFDARINIFPDESGDNQIRLNRSFKNYYKHLFSIKGGGNLKFFTICAIKNCPKIYLPQYLVIGISRRCIGYLRDWALGK